MRILLAFVLLGFLLTNCCKSGPEYPIILNERHFISDSVLADMYLNPLDTLLSDKISDDLSHIKRRNNFHRIVGMPLTVFRKPSKLYHFQLLDSSYAVLSQKHSFTHARSSSVVVHFDQDGKVRDYFILEDYFIKDIMRYKDGVAVVGTDYENKNVYWNQKNNAKIVYLDESLKERFCYESADWKVTGLPLYFEADLHIVKGKIACFVGVITGCHICYSTVDLILNDKGKCINYSGNRESGQSRSITRDEIRTLFY